MIDRDRYDLSIIVISTNEGADLRACLASIFLNRADFECILVDNASTDETTTVISQYSPRSNVSVITNTKAKGFIENNNDAMVTARGRYILLLNPDTIVDKDTLTTMISFMDTHPDCAVSTCKLLNQDGTIQFNCRAFPSPLTYLVRVSNLDKIFPISL